MTKGEEIGILIDAIVNIDKKRGTLTKPELQEKMKLRLKVAKELAHLRIKICTIEGHE